MDGNKDDQYNHPKKSDSETPPPPPPVIEKKNLLLNLLSIAVLLVACVIAVFVADMLLTGSIWENPWLLLVAGLIICGLVTSYLSKTKHVKITNLIIYVCLVIAFVMMFVYDYQANKPTNKASAQSTISPASGKILNVELKPDEVYNVDDLATGQKWRYLSFNGAFSHRIDKGDGKACWKVVDNNLPWSADYTGKLQVKAGNTPVKLTVNVL
ncbi:MAG: hypothetical protein V1801_02515 [Candidatus Falkowbacteria bacterium]